MNRKGRIFSILIQSGLVTFVVGAIAASIVMQWGWSRAAPPWLVLLGFLGFAVSTIFFSRYVSERYRNLQLEVQNSPAVRAHDPRAPIVYLRSFRDEKQILKTYRNAWPTEEEQLARVFQPFGPFIAIADPRDDLPQLGAARLNAGKDWPDKLKASLQEALFVVLRLGNSRGVLWELETAISTLPPQKLLLLNPLNKTAWSATREAVHRQLGLQLPEFSRRPSIIYFTDTWNPIRASIEEWQLRGSFSQTYLESGLLVAAMPFLFRLGLQPKPPTLDPFKVAAALLVTFCLVMISFGSLLTLLMFTLNVGIGTHVTFVDTAAILVSAAMSVAFGVLLACLVGSGEI